MKRYEMRLHEYRKRKPPYKLDPEHISTPFAECTNLTIRMSMPRLSGPSFPALATFCTPVSGRSPPSRLSEKNPPRHDPHHAPTSCRKHLVMNRNFPDRL